MQAYQSPDFSDLLAEILLPYAYFAHLVKHSWPKFFNGNLSRSTVRQFCHLAERGGTVVGCFTDPSWLALTSRYSPAGPRAWQRGEDAMEFRWIAAITLWTMLSGPVLIHWSSVIPRPGSDLPPISEHKLPPATVEVDVDWTLPVVLVDELP